MSPEQLRDELRKRDLRIVIDAGAQFHGEVAMAREMLTDAKAVGAAVVRDTISSVLCGDRRKLEGGWDAHLAKVAERLKAVLPHAEELGLAIAMENHQDATSTDLLRLWEMSGSSPAYGVTLDTGNALAVGEGPVEYARRIAPIIRHLHCKDYTIHFAPEGYRLVRCAAGDGVVDFPAILEIARANGHEMIPGNEIAAQATRTIPLLEDTWWAEYPKEQSEYLVEALRVLWVKGRPFDEPYSSAWERGEGSAAVDAEEWDMLRRSVAYFSAL
jgi:sugar phosphate isomerase/epimerase